MGTNLTVPNPSESRPKKPQGALVQKWKKEAESEINIHRVGYVSIGTVGKDLRDLLRRAKTPEEIEQGLFGSK
jgi:hypothetical protein